MLAATASYLAVLLAQWAGLLPAARVLALDAWTVAAFNLLLLNVVGGLTALLSEAYRRSRQRLASLYRELEQAYDAASRLNVEIQRAAGLQALGEVVAGVTHEIGNALQGLVLPLGTLREQLAGTAPDAVRHLDRMEYACAAIQRIVQNVLQTTRQGSEERVAVSLAEVAQRTLELKGYDLRRTGIEVRLEFPAGFPLVLGNPFRLQQVLLNLVTNAQDAMRDGPRKPVLTITGLTVGDRAVVEVRDTGPGIPAEVFPRLFEPFYTTKPQGTGLGLAISADIVRGMGGELTARNGPEGAIFRVSLPVAPSVTAGSASSGLPARGG